MSIIKRKKRDQFFIMSNHAAQQELTSLNAIGLLAYIKSLPEDWILHKTFLYKKFTRRTVESAWAELVEKKYIAGFSCYVDRKKRYYYLVNDEPLTQSDFDELIEDTLEEVSSEGFTAKNLQPINDCAFSVVQNVHHAPTPAVSCVVQNVQHLECSTTSTVPDVQIQRINNKEIEQRNNNKEIINNIVNNDNYNNLIKESFLKNGKGLFSVEEIDFLTDHIISELEVDPKFPEPYFDSIIKTIVFKRGKKLGIVPPAKVPFYNWLEE